MNQSKYARADIEHNQHNNQKSLFVLEHTDSFYDEENYTKRQRFTYLTETLTFLAKKPIIAPNIAVTNIAIEKPSTNERTSLISLPVTIFVAIISVQNPIARQHKPDKPLKQTNILVDIGCLFFLSKSTFLCYFFE